MKNKIFSSIFAAELCGAALSVQAFAADITKDRSVYAENAEELAGSLKDIAMDTLEWTVDPNSVMPLYYAKITDLINNGALELSAEMPSGKNRYIVDLIDSDGEYAGMGEIDKSKTGELVLSCYKPRYDPFGVEQIKPASFSYHSEEIKSVLAAKGIDTDVKEVKLVFIDGIGGVYYIDNGKEEVLVPAWSIGGGVISDYFPGNTYYDAVVVNDKLRATAIRLEEENDRLLAEAGGYGAGGTGGEGNPNTGGTGSALAVELGVALTTCVIGISAAKKKKDQ